MIQSIGRRPSAERGPLEALLDCHERIRRFSAMAIELGRADVEVADRAAAAGAVLRYFEEALPLHVADEELDLEPMLARLAPDAALFGLLGALRRQHRRIEAMLGELAPRWRAAAAGDPPDAAALAELVARAEELREAFDEHLALEEAELLPRARAALAAGDLDALAAAMRGRRAPRSG